MQQDSIRHIQLDSASGSHQEVVGSRKRTSILPNGPLKSETEEEFIGNRTNEEDYDIKQEQKEILERQYVKEPSRLSIPFHSDVISSAFNCIDNFKKKISVLRILQTANSDFSHPLHLSVITLSLRRCQDDESSRMQRTLAAPRQFQSQWKLCGQLRHYKQAGPRQRGMGVLSESQVINFSNRPFDDAHLPAGVPREKTDMRLEANRLATFALDGRPPFPRPRGDRVTPELLAAEGFFYTQEGDRVKCAFCLGVLQDFAPDGWETPRDLHRLRLSTCPFLLGLNVANVPACRPETPQLRAPQACTEECPECPEEAPAFHAPASSVWGLADPNLLALDSCRPRLPVSVETAAAACRRGVADNLEMLFRSLQSPEQAAHYHPQRHPTCRDPRDREASLVRASQPLPPPELLSAAGFFLDAELLTSCYWCGLQLLGWQFNDDPWVEHARWSPRCCHLLLERGHEFVLRSRASCPPWQPQAAEPIAAGQGALEPDCSPTLQSIISGSSPLVDYRIEPRYFKAREDSPAAQSVLRLGLDPDDLRTAQFVQLKGTGDDYASPELLLRGVLAQQAERTALGLCAREFHERVRDQRAAAAAQEPRPLGDDELDWRACKVCMDRVINVTLLDCKHLCCCSNCVKQLDSCPLCRSPIRATMIVNLN